MLSLNTNRLEHYARNWIAFGFFVYLGAFFLLGRGATLIPFLVFIVLPTLFLCAVSRFKCIHDKRAVFVCAAFLGYLSLSALWGEGSFFKALENLLYILCLMLSIENVSQRFTEKFVIKFIIAIGLIAAIIYIFAIFVSSHNLMAIMSGRFSIYDIAGWGRKNQIDTGIIIGLPIIAGWYFFPRKKWHVQLLLIVVIMLCTTILVLVTKSRSPMVAAAITLLCIILYRREKSDLILLFLFFMLVGVVFLSANKFGNIIPNRFGENSYRLILWRGGLELFSDHWLFGQGYGTPAKIALDSVDNLGSHVHNMFIEILRIGGIVAGMLFVCILNLMFRFSYIHFENRFFIFWLIFGLLNMIPNGRIPLVHPGGVEVFAFWLPFFLFYYMRKRSDPLTTNISVTHEKVGQH
ncbi:MAG: O-antigen ligase family protein [Betaproteobacteria bacterium]|nr:O-antigen ligase family protein [Betaproteobacteria bacterium]